MHRSTFVASVSALALILSAGQALAQQPTTLQAGQEVSGRLGEGDDRVDNDEEGQFVADAYPIQGRRGQRIEVTMRADAFDAYLELFGPDAEPVASDDDGLGEGTNARLRFTFPSDGAYTLRARTLSGFEAGDYTLKVVDRGPAPPAPRPTALRLGAPVQGELSEEDPEYEDAEYGAYIFDGYSFRAREGERIAVSLESEDFDPMVRVGRMDGDLFEELASNDDRPSGGGLDSYLVFTAPAAGEYVVRATPLGGTETGAYTVRIAEGPPPIETRPIALGEEIEGELTDRDGANPSGQRADAYTFEGQPGQRIVATMNSDDFDAYLDLYFGEGDSRYVVDSDDDGAGEGTDSRLSYTLTEAGQYTLEARAFSEDGAGDYTLSLEEAPPEPEPAPLAYGTTIQGEIADGDPRDDENRAFDAFRISGEQGNRIQVIMRSGDFDSFLQIGSPEGDFYAMASDDDGLGEGTDSRLNYILPSTGEFILRASPLFADADGLYSLELIDRGPQPTPGSILVGATARGSLSEDDAIAEDGSFYDAYRITVKEGEKLRLTMVSNEFDTYLDIGREDDEGLFTSVVSDDDSLSDTHAKVDWAVEEEGDYIIRARSFSQGQSGAYALTVEARE